MARRRGETSEGTGTRIRAAALSLFAQDGYAAVSMRRIAQEVGLQVGGLYNHTPDKQTLLYELMRAHMETLLQAVPEATGDAEADLERFVRFHIAFHRARQDEIFISYNELRNLEPQNFERIEALRRAYEEHLIVILRALPVGEPKVAAMAIIAMLTGIATWYRAEGRLGPQAIEDLYCEMVRGLVGLGQEGQP